MTLEKSIRKIIDATNAEFGVSIQHIESGDTININAEQLFPMCSVLKIPVMCEAFRQFYERGTSLDERWELTLAEKNLPSGVLVFLQDGLQITIRDLLTLMIIISDNTATDMIINRIGLSNIEPFMAKLGLPNIHLCMTIRDIFTDIYGQDGADPTQVLTNLTQPQAQFATKRDGRAYQSTPKNDTSSPEDMTKLLGMIFRGEVINRAACDEMLHILLQQQINDRLPCLLPDGVPFAHKTGTLSGLRNDAGILYANDDAHIALTVYTRWDADKVAENPAAEIQRTTEIDQAFGQIGLTVYNHFNSKSTIFMPVIAS